MNASIDWLCLPVLAIALVQLLTRPWHRRLLLAVVLASVGVQVGECYEQYFVGFDETWEHYESIKEDFWASQGVALDSPKVEVFELRIKSGEVTGSLSHANVAGSYLVLCGMAALGVVLGVRVGTGGAVGWMLTAIAAIVPAFVGGAAFLTNSLGAYLSAAAGLLIWLTAWWFRSWIDAHRAKAVFVGWACVFGGLVAVVGHGLYHDSLPGWSLTFRWQWWNASSELIVDHALTGVGRENFGRHYLAYKPIESPEEVANPHNLFVQAGADWGVLGMAGMVAMLIGGSLAVVGLRGRRDEGTEGRRDGGSDEATKRRSGEGARAARVSGRMRDGRSSGRHTLPDGRGSESSSSPGLIVWTVALGLAVTLGRRSLLGTDDPDFLYYKTVTTAFLWVLGFFLFAGVLGSAAVATDTGRRVVRTGVSVGLLTFLLHDMINFAMFVPATATTFFALMAYCVSDRSSTQLQTEPMSAGARWGPLGVHGVIVAFVVVFGLVPVVRSSKALHMARASVQVLPAPVEAQLPYNLFRRAAAADSLDPTPLAELAGRLMRSSQVARDPVEVTRFAAKALTEAIAADPFDLKLRRRRIQLRGLIAETSPSRENHEAAIKAAREALELYPKDPHGLVLLGDRQLAAGEAFDSHDLLREAVETYRQALELDEQRLWWEELRRFSDRERQSVKAKIEQAEQALATPDTAGD